MLKNAVRAADLPAQLQKAKESLSAIETQLREAKRSVLKRVAQSGVSSCQQDIQELQRLESDYMKQWSSVDELQKQQSAPRNSFSKSNKSRSVDRGAERGRPGMQSPSGLGSSLIDDIVGKQPIINVSGMNIRSSAKGGNESVAEGYRRNQKKGKKGNAAAKSPVSLNELPPLPSQVKDSISQMASTNGGRPVESIFSLLRPMNEASQNGGKDASSVLPSVTHLLDFDALENTSEPPESSPQTIAPDSLPFTENLELGQEFQFNFEDPFQAEVDRMKKEEEERKIAAVEAEKPREATPAVDYEALRKSAHSKFDGLFGDTFKEAAKAISETPAKFDETLASNPKAVAAAQSVVAPEAVSDSSNAKPAAKGGKARRAKKEASQKTIAIEEEVTVQTVSKLLGLPVRECIERLGEMEEGVSSKDDLVSCDAVELLAMDLDVAVRVKNQFNLQPTDMAASPHDLPPRAPVVAVMGHVDHGKTTLLDYLRKSSVAAKEAGGITQRISAFNVSLSKDNKITFIDTPGHAAFTAMRKRGACATDIVLLIIAADDGIKEQTKEVLKLIEETKLPMVVAVTKCGLKTVNKKEAIKRISTQLLDYDVVTTPFGGDVNIIGIDSKTGEGIDDLKELLYEEGVMKEIRADPKARGEGVVFESNVSEGVGTTINTIVRWGNFRVGSVCVVGEDYGRIKRVLCDGKSVKKAVAGDTVQITGISRRADSGEWLLEVKNEAEAVEVVNYRKRRRERLAAIQRKKAEANGETGETGETEEEKKVVDIPLVVKADEDGSLLALRQEIAELNASIHNAQFHVVSASMGQVSQSDVETARDCKGVLLGFNTKIPSKLQKAMRTMHVPSVTGTIIYSLFDALKEEAEAFMPVVNMPVVSASCVVKQTFVGSDKDSLIAGCEVKTGTMTRQALYRIVRDNQVIFKGTGFSSIRHFKDEVEQIGAGKECGIHISGYTDFKEGDVIETYEYKDVRQPLE